MGRDVNQLLHAFGAKLRRAGNHAAAHAVPHQNHLPALPAGEIHRAPGIIVHGHIADFGRHVQAMAGHIRRERLMVQFIQNVRHLAPVKSAGGGPMAKQERLAALCALFCIVH